MHIIISKSILENILTNTINFIEKKDNSQITSHILLEANKHLRIKATDHNFGIDYIDNSTQIIQEGIATINGKKFYEIIKALNDDFIDIKIEKNIAIISQNHSIYRLTSFDAKEFPSFPDTKELQKIELKSLEFIEGLQKIFPVIDNNNPKYELNGALIDITENSLNLISTDTKRLAFYKIAQTTQKELQIIIPKKAIAEIKKLFLNEFEIYFDEINLIIKSNNITFFTKLINGKFPDYRRILPKEYKEVIQLNKNSFTKALKQINIISNEIKIILEKNKMTFESISEETLEAKTDIEIKTNLEHFVFAVNSRFILDFLSVTDDDIEICLNDENIPFTLRDKNFQTIIMPLTI